MAQIVPLSSLPDQTLNVSLNVDGKTLRLTLRVYFNEMAQYWVLDIFNAQGAAILSSLPLITGDWPAGNILGQYGYLLIGSAFVINLGQVSSDYPDATELGPNFVLLWDDTAL